MLIERHGRFHQLIKNSKSKRINKEKDAIKDQKNKELSTLIEKQAEEIDQMKEELIDYRERVENHERDTELLKRLYENGYIDLNGDPIDRNER